MSQRGWPSIMYPGMKTRVRPAPGQSRVPNSIFLAGPTLREPNTGRSWRNPVHTTLLGTCSAAAQIARRP